jgi:hypothetical protein
MTTPSTIQPASIRYPMTAPKPIRPTSIRRPSPISTSPNPEPLNAELRLPD